MKVVTGIGWSMIVLVGLAACGNSNEPTTAATHSTASPTTTAAHPTTTRASSPETFVADVWADNWFSLYVNGKLVGEDSVPITTQRSFNKERITFTATYPLAIAIVAKDYIQDASGLEYIGAPQQQIGDGGLIAQIRDTTGKIVATTNGAWKTLVTQRAPLNPTCVKSTQPITDCKHESRATPTGWTTPSYDDTAWPKATVYTEAEVQPHGDYGTVSWDAAAKLIWAADLEIDNVLLLRSSIIQRP